ncbi:MAG: ATP synthase F0 subunit C [Brevefilum sp.]|jgi:F-type H+-transporting ATPase subunit c
MWQLDSETIITIVTTLGSIIGIVLGSVAPSIMEGIVVKKTLDGIARQPEAANELRTTMLISMALLESGSIYVLLIVLVLLFANPLLGRFF